MFGALQNEYPHVIAKYYGKFQSKVFLVVKVKTLLSTRGKQSDNIWQDQQLRSFYPNIRVTTEAERFNRNVQSFK